MKKTLIMASALALAAIAVPAPLAFAEPPAAAAKMNADQIKFDKGLNKQTGDIQIPQANAVLHLGDKYYFLGPDEARKVLVDVWGNPPSEASDVLGLVVPAGKTVFDNAWGAVITFRDSGYVTDDDAGSADYDKVLTDMRSGEEENNAERTKGGYKAIHLVGWAQPPSYDKANHSLIWARELKIDGQPVDTLNYDVRVLGRKGVLSMNMLWDMDHLAEVRTAAADFGKVASFTSGSTYAEYNASTDKAAGYGLAGLVAGGVALAAAKKIGLLALLAPFFKWILLGLAAMGAAMKGFIGRLFGRKPASDNDAGIS